MLLSVHNTVNMCYKYDQVKQQINLILASVLEKPM